MADDPPVAGRAPRTAVFVVPGSAAGERLDVFLAEQDGLDLTRSAIQRLIRSHRVWVNGRTARPSRRLEPGEEVVIELPEPAPSGVVPEALPLDVVYEDPDVVVLNKPRGWVVHPAPGHPQGTLANALLARYPEMEGSGARDGLASSTAWTATPRGSWWWPAAPLRTGSWYGRSKNGGSTASTWPWCGAGPRCGRARWRRPSAAIRPIGPG